MMRVTRQRHAEIKEHGREQGKKMQIEYFRRFQAPSSQGRWGGNRNVAVADSKLEAKSRVQLGPNPPQPTHQAECIFKHGGVADNASIFCVLLRIRNSSRIGPRCSLLG